MNIDSATSEPFYRFLRFREEFDRRIKVAHGALMILEANATKLTITELPVGEEPWGETTKWSDISEQVEGSAHFISQLALVYIVSGFEDFRVGIRSELSRLKSLSGQPDTPHTNTEVDESKSEKKLLGFCVEQGLSTAQFSFYLPLVDYIEECRNCIVHRGGRASSSLVETAGSSELEKCLLKWPGKQPPPLPELEANKAIRLMPRHAILASDVYHRIAIELNKQLIGKLGEIGLLNMAAYHGLLSPDPIDTGAKNTPEAFINNILFNRYRVTEHDAEKTPRLLKEMEKWDDCRRAFASLGRPNQRGQADCY
jgi:hypothetical protein